MFLGKFRKRKYGCILDLTDNEEIFRTFGILFYINRTDVTSLVVHVSKELFVYSEEFSKIVGAGVLSDSSSSSLAKTICGSTSRSSPEDFAPIRLRKSPIASSKYGSTKSGTTKLRSELGF
jgi:hypothetical protein